MKTVVYFNRSKITSRVFASLVDRDDLDQTIVTTSGGDFNISKVKIFDGDLNKAQKIISKIKPDVLVQTEIPERIVVPKITKRIFVNHGIMHKATNVPLASGGAKVHKKFDLYCGQTKIFGDFVNHIMGGGKHNMLYNVLPQLDLLYTDYCKSRMGKTLDQLDFKPNLIILFCVSCCKDIPKFVGHNEDYFETILELNRLATKRNWLVIVKPRYSNDKMIKSASKVSKLSKYVGPYKKILGSKHLVFLSHEDDIYRYLFADVVLLNGTSTFEVESIIAGKPTIMTRINKRNEDFYDPFETISRGAAHCVKKVSDLRQAIEDKVRDQKKQEEFINWYGIRSDGLAHKRLQDAILKI
jgi:hypothetical protein